MSSINNQMIEKRHSLMALHIKYPNNCNSNNNNNLDCKAIINPQPIVKWLHRVKL